MAKKLVVSEELFTHRYLWNTAIFLLKTARPQEDSFPFLLPALLVAYAAYEAFIDYCGQILYPEVWAHEKAFFKGKGDAVEAKVAKLLEFLPDVQWEKGKRPYQTIKRLKNFRDMTVHGKVIATRYITEEKPDMTHYKWRHPWDKFLTIGKVETSMHDIRSFCGLLVESIRRRSIFVIPLSDGPLAMSSASSIPADQALQARRKAYDKG